MKNINGNVTVGKLATLGKSLVKFHQTKAMVLNDLYFENQMKEFSELIEELILMINQNRFKTNLSSIDNERNDLVRRLFNSVKGYGFLFDVDDPRQQSVILLRNINSKYKTIFRKDDATQSALINSLLKDLEQTESLQAINELAELDNIVNKLKVVQSNYEDEVSRTNEIKETRKSATECKKQVLDYYNTRIRKNLEAMLLREENKYAEIVSRFDLEVEAVNNDRTKKTTKQKETTEEIENSEE